MTLIAGIVIGAVGILALQVAWAAFLDWWFGFVATLKEVALTVFYVVAFSAIAFCLLYASGWRPDGVP